MPVSARMTKRQNIFKCTTLLPNFLHIKKNISQQARQTMSPQQLGPNHDTKITNIQKDIPILEQKLKDAQYKAASAIYSGVQVLQRHHFSSKLQRMSVVCKCENTSKNGAKGKILLNIVLCLFFSTLCGALFKDEMYRNAESFRSHYFLLIFTFRLSLMFFSLPCTFQQQKRAGTVW